VYALIAVGITVIFGVMRMINFASGAFFTLSMYLGYWGYLITGWNAYALIPFVMLTSAVCAVVTYKTAVAPVLNESRDATILTTVGLGFFLQNIVIIIFGGSGLSLPSTISAKSMILGEFTIGYPRLFAFIAAVIMVIIIAIMIHKTTFGRAMRATSENSEVAEMLGINTRNVFMAAWIIGIVMTCIGGIMLTPLYHITAAVGAPYRTTPLIAVVLGGLGDIRGAYLCGILLGVVEAIVASVVEANIGALGVFVVYLIIFFFKPQGLFGKKERVG
jgi:branched-chain amino acid transport system permease protein